MTANRDFKRLVRRRMQKTGESYTAARHHLLNKQQPRSRAAPAVPAIVATVPVAPDLARLAGMSNDAIKARTGCNWEKWVWVLDKAGAYDWPHRDIAEYVHTRFKVPGWWTQTVTVGYERIKGLRQIGQRRDGGFEASRSRTFPVPVGRLFRAFRDSRTRARWLPGVKLTIRTATIDRSMRITWPDKTAVDAWFTSKGAAKSQVAVTHRKLAGKDDAIARKEFWSERLAALGEILKG